MIVRHATGLVGFEISDTDPLALSILKREIRDEASARHAQYPQYEGHWNGPEWRIARVSRSIRTKLGQAFESGELVLARDRDASELAQGVDGAVAYSRSNGINTVIPETALEFVEAVQA